MYFVFLSTYDSSSHLIVILILRFFFSYLMVFFFFNQGYFVFNQKYPCNPSNLWWVLKFIIIAVEQIYAGIKCSRSMMNSWWVRYFWISKLILDCLDWRQKLGVKCVGMNRKTAVEPSWFMLMISGRLPNEFIDKHNNNYVPFKKIKMKYQYWINTHVILSCWLKLFD